ncbi:hypothetical protein MTR67_003350 [Solanum verrucosum]|uniref:Uncharacterized protein n=1 Tax=Solanum verrucosum TaxID=315347 RepID=A0AAF0PU59_SOLVR|nr:hypothetical protein MTR67_003350 [Solanum verrucosum]
MFLQFVLAFSAYLHDLGTQWHSRTPSTDRRWTHGLSCRPTVRRSHHGLWSVDQDFPYTAFDTNYGRAARTVNRSTVRRSDRGTHGHHPRTVDGLTVCPAGPWLMTENFPRSQLENLAKSLLMDRPTVRRSHHGLWSVDQDFPYTAFDTNYGRAARTVNRSTVRRSDRR